MICGKNRITAKFLSCLRLSVWYFIKASPSRKRKPVTSIIVLFRNQIVGKIKDKVRFTEQLRQLIDHSQLRENLSSVLTYLYRTQKKSEVHKLIQSVKEISEPILK